MFPHLPPRLLALALLLTSTGTVFGQNINDLDRSVRPGDDFYRYANGGWLGTAKIPAGQKSFDTRAILAAKTSERVRTLIQDAAASHAVKGTLAQKVGDYYA